MKEARTKSKKIRKAYGEMSPGEVELALEENKKIFESHFDAEYVKHLNHEIVDMLNWYFRPVFVGFEEMPQRNNPDHPLILACNHSGMAFPWDAIIFGTGLFHKHGYDLNKLFRAMASPMLSASNLMNPFLLTDLWKRVGAVDATGLNFETMMHYQDSNLLIYPEGVPGIGKGFNRKYQLQKFSTSMVRMAIKYKTDIVGVSCVNGEYINPFSYTSRRLNKLVQKIGIPYLPVALQTPFLLIQPWLFYYAFPAKLTYVRGRRFKAYEMVDHRPLEEVSMEEIRNIRDHIQQGMQEDLDKAVKEYGQKPYDWKEFGQSLRKHWWDLPYWTPIGWPALFTEFDSRYQKEEKAPKGIIRGWFRFWKIALRNPIVFAYYIPIFGWIPILIKGLRGRKIVRSWEGSQS